MKSHSIIILLVGTYLSFVSAQECVHKGKTYQNGDSFPDDCNTCSCVDGAAQCTEIACLPSDNTVPKPKILPNIEVNWKLVNNTYYYMGKDTNSILTFTLNEAQDHCKDNGGKLAEPQNRKEMDNLDIFAQLDSGWIGIKRHQNCTMSYVSNNATIDQSWLRLDREYNCSTSNATTKCGSIDTLATEVKFFDCNKKQKFFICEQKRAQQCLYKGQIIQDGDRFKAGCNTCRCRRGKIGGCTKKFCGGCQTNIDCAKAGSN